MVIFLFIAFFYAINVHYNEDAVITIDGTVYEDIEPFKHNIYYLFVVVFIGMTVLDITYRWAFYKMFNKDKSDS